MGKVDYYWLHKALTLYSIHSYYSFTMRVCTVQPYLWIFPEISRFFRILETFSLAIFKHHRSQWDAVLHSVSLGPVLFENTIKVSSVVCIKVNICQNLWIFHGPVMVTLYVINTRSISKRKENIMNGFKSIIENATFGLKEQMLHFPQF